jgi:type I restriction enzyme S subunit
MVSNVDKKSADGDPAVRLVNYTDVYYNSAITPQLPLKEATATPEQVRKFRVLPGDSIITKDSETPDDIGVPAFIESATPDMVCGYHLAMLRPRRGLHPKFLYWALASTQTREQLAVAANGMTRYGLTYDAIQSVEIPVPGVEEQRRIADFLDDQTTAIDQIITGRGCQIRLEREVFASELESVLASLSGFTVALSWILVSGVQDGPHETPTFVDEGIPFLSVDSIVDDRINFVGTRLISPEEHERFARKCRPRRGDVLLTKAASVGKVAVVDTDIDFNVWSPIAVMRPRPDAVVPSFLAWALRSSGMQRQMALASTNSTQNNLAMRDIASLRLVLPVLEAQSQSAAEMERLKHRADERQSALRGSISLLEELRLSLISAAVSGEFDVAAASGRGVRA